MTNRCGNRCKPYAGTSTLTRSALTLRSLQPPTSVDLLWQWQLRHVKCRAASALVARELSDVVLVNEVTRGRRMLRSVKAGCRVASRISKDRVRARVEIHIIRDVVHLHKCRTCQVRLMLDASCLADVLQLGSWSAARTVDVILESMSITSACRSSNVRRHLSDAVPLVRHDEPAVVHFVVLRDLGPRPRTADLRVQPQQLVAFRHHLGCIGSGSRCRRCDYTDGLPAKTLAQRTT